MFSCMDKVDGDIFFMVATHKVCEIDIYLFVLFRNQQYTIVDVPFLSWSPIVIYSYKCGSQMANGKGKTMAFEKLKGLIIWVYITI